MDPRPHPFAAKLSHDQADEVRRLRARGLPLAELAGRFGVSKSSLSRVIHLKSHAPEGVLRIALPEFEVALLFRALRDVADCRLDPTTRNAAARALAFLLRERLVDERVATDVLTELHKSIDLPKIVRTLLLGLVGVSAPEKITEWTRAVADRALRQGHLASFVTAMRILVELSGYDGTVPARWRVSLLRAIAMKSLAPRGQEDRPEGHDQDGQVCAEHLERLAGRRPRDLHRGEEEVRAAGRSDGRRRGL